MIVCLANPFFLASVQAALQRHFKVNYAFVDPRIYGVEMAELAVGLCLFQFNRIIRLNAVDTLVISFNYFFMRKILLGKRGFDVTFRGAIDVFRDRVMGNLGNGGVAVVAGDIFVYGVGKNMFVDVVVMSLAVFVDSTDKPVFVTHQAVFFV